MRKVYFIIFTMILFLISCDEIERRSEKDSDLLDGESSVFDADADLSDNLSDEDSSESEDSSDPDIIEGFDEVADVPDIDIIIDITVGEHEACDDHRTCEGELECVKGWCVVEGWVDPYKKCTDTPPTCDNSASYVCENGGYNSCDPEYPEDWTKCHAFHEESYHCIRFCQSDYECWSPTEPMFCSLAKCTDKYTDVQYHCWPESSREKVEKYCEANPGD